MKEENTLTHFFVDGKPVGKGRPRFSKYGHAYTPKTTRDYESVVRSQFLYYKTRYYGDAPIMMRIEAVFGVPTSYNKKTTQACLDDVVRPTKKPDADNIVKAICDALNKVAYEDDSNVVKLLFDKKYGENPHVSVYLDIWKHGDSFNEKKWEVSE